MNSPEAPQPLAKAPEALFADFRALQDELKKIAAKTKRTTDSKKNRATQLAGPTIFIRGK